MRSPRTAATRAAVTRSAAQKWAEMNNLRSDIARRAEAIMPPGIEFGRISMEMLDPGGMLATDAPLDRLGSLIDSLAGQVFFANYNAPDQTVLAGTLDGLAAVERQIALLGFQSQRLPVPRPFHTPLMAPVVLMSRLMMGSVSSL